MPERSIVDIQRRQNRLYIRFDDATEMEATRRELRQFCRSVLDPVVVDELLKAILISRGLAADDESDGLDSVIGTRVTFNPRAILNICKVT